MNIIELQNTLQNMNITITAREIAKTWGMDETSFSKKKKIGSQIKHKNIVQLENKLGITLTPDKIPSQYTKLYKLIEKNPGTPIGEEYIKVDYYPDVFGSCGGGAFVFSEHKEVMEVPRKCFKSFSGVKTYSVINAIGDSMYPFIMDKDRLIVEHYNGEQIKDNRVYVFRFYDNIFIKRLILNLDQVVVKSDNTQYQVRYIERNEAENLQIIGQIVGIMRDV